MCRLLVSSICVLQCLAQCRSTLFNVIHYHLISFSVMQRPIIEKFLRCNLAPDGGKLHRLFQSSMPNNIPTRSFVACGTSPIAARSCISSSFIIGAPRYTTLHPFPYWWCLAPRSTKLYSISEMLHTSQHFASAFMNHKHSQRCAGANQLARRQCR